MNNTTTNKYHISNLPIMEGRLDRVNTWIETAIEVHLMSDSAWLKEVQEKNICKYERLRRALISRIARIKKSN